MKKLIISILCISLLLFSSCDELMKKQNEEPQIPSNALLYSIKGKSYSFLFDEYSTPSTISIDDNGVILFDDESSLDEIFEGEEYTISYNCTEFSHEMIVSGYGYWANGDGTETRVKVVLNRLIEKAFNGLYFSSSCKTYTLDGHYYATEIAYQTIIPCYLELIDDGTDTPDETTSSIKNALLNTKWSYHPEEGSTRYLSISEDGSFLIDNLSLPKMFGEGQETTYEETDITYSFTLEKVYNSEALIGKVFESNVGMVNIVYNGKIEKIGNDYYYESSCRIFDLDGVELYDEVEQKTNGKVLLSPYTPGTNDNDPLLEVYFYQCDYLAQEGAPSECIVPEGITLLAGTPFDDFFENCGQLKSLTLPVSIRGLSYNLFEDCPLLTDIYFGGDTTQWNAMGLNFNNQGKVIVHCADGDLIINEDSEVPSQEAILNISNDALYYDLLETDWQFSFTEEIEDTTYTQTVDIYVDDEGFIVLYESDVTSLDEFFPNGYTLEINSTKDLLEVILTGEAELWEDSKPIGMFKAIYYKQITKDSEGDYYFNVYLRAYDDEGNMIYDEPTYFQGSGPYLLSTPGKTQDDESNEESKEPLINATEDSLFYTLKNTDWQFSFTEEIEDTTYTQAVDIYVDDEGFIVLYESDVTSLDEFFPNGYTLEINSTKDLLEVILTGEAELWEDNKPIGMFKAVYYKQITKDSEGDYYFNVYLRAYDDEGNMIYDEPTYFLGLGPFPMTERT